MVALVVKGIKPVWKKLCTATISLKKPDVGSSGPPGDLLGFNLKMNFVISSEEGGADIYC